jgi:uncharacterized membrane protein YoaK (UPF0700 family)
VTTRPTFDLFLLTWAAGNMDALSYLRAGIFTANMTGNTVVLGLGLAGHEPSRVIPALVALLAYALGVAIAAATLARSGARRHWSQDLKLGTGLELPFVLVFVLLTAVVPEPVPFPFGVALTVLAAIALGIQSVAVWELRISGIWTTFITGTLTMAVLFWVGREESPSGARERGSPLLLASILFCYLAAAAVGGVLRHHRIAAAVIPFAAVLTAQIRARTIAPPGPASIPQLGQ